MVAGANGIVHLVWERKTDNQVVPVWNWFRDTTWHIPQTLTVRPEADAWYPTAELLPDNRLVIAWSSRSSDRVTIETIVYNDIDGDGVIDDTDNCPNDSNPGQEDLDSDGIGDACDVDADGDGYEGVLGSGEDCDDTNASINPDATEVCNGVDDDCDGQIDEGVKNTYYKDADGDGYG
ncbi:MAG TPA: hypothetical protein EYP19_05030, partial [Desulfobacterales bacterium]|nr:hypothetical protein [Desulfobacterales bacterium]